MKLKRAIGAALMLYVFAFVVGIAGAMAVGFDYEAGGDPPLSLWVVGIAAGILGTAFFTKWYFKKDTPSLEAGAKLGGLYIGVGFVLDFLMFLPMILAGTADQLLQYYAHWAFWATVAVIIGTSALVGKHLDEK